jgi:hypothetical protein
MRLNLALAAFAVVSLALTSGCAAKFGEDDANDPELNPRSGELANVTEGARTPVGEKQIQAVPTNPDQAIGSPADRVTQRDYFVQGSLGPAAGVPDIKESMDQDQQLKKSFVQATAAAAGQGDAEDRQTNTDVN